MSQEFPWQVHGVDGSFHLDLPRIVPSQLGVYGVEEACNEGGQIDSFCLL